MSILLQISDPHFGTEQAHVVAALLELAQQQPPDVVILSGDITQRARAKQFAAARAFVDRIDAPVLAIPGNHDIPLFNLWARLQHPYARHIAAFGTDLEPIHLLHDLLVVCVNTTRAYRHKNGEISAQQIERVAAQLARATDQQLCVVVVHQPVAVTRDADIPNLLRGRESALERWAAAGADIVMGGHIHLPYVLQLPDLVRPVWAVQAGTAVSSRTRQGVPNSVNILRCGADSKSGDYVVEQWDHVAVKQAFICVATTTTATAAKLKA